MVWGGKKNGPFQGHNCIHRSISRFSTHLQVVTYSTIRRFSTEVYLA